MSRIEKYAPPVVEESTFFSGADEVIDSLVSPVVRHPSKTNADGSFYVSKKRRKAEKPSTLLLDLRELVALPIDYSRVNDLEVYAQELREAASIKRKLYDVLSPLMSEQERGEANFEADKAENAVSDLKKFQSIYRRVQSDLKIGKVKYANQFNAVELIINTAKLILDKENQDDK